MKYAVKYCGGCHPEFDRGALGRKLNETLGTRLGSPDPQVVYDEVFVISGCTARCADVKYIQAKKLTYIDPHEFERLFAGDV